MRRMRKDTNNKMMKENAKEVTRVRITTKKSNLVKFAIFQFLGLLILAITVIVIFVLSNNKTESTTKSATAEPQTQIIEKEVPVVDEEMVNTLAEEKANKMFTVFKTEYIAQADMQLTEETINTMFEELKNNYIAQADATEVEQLANEKALALMEEYKAQIIAEQEAARVATLSTISVYIYGAKEFYLDIQGSLYDRLTYDVIYAALQADPRFEGCKVNRITNKDAVEVFVGEDFRSTRTIRIELA